MAVGIVIVSHSATLAEGVRELVAQLTQGRARLATAGGVADPEQPFGTDATAVMEAIQAVDSPEGVLVLMDLGSALLSAGLALELLPDEQRARVRLCAAPLVEGAVAAAIQATLGADLDQVAREALGALAAKASELGPPPATPQAPLAPEPIGEGERIVTLPNALGLHARPAAEIAALASRFEAQVRVRNRTREGVSADARSITQLMLLGARQGHTLGLSANGPQARQALDALEARIQAGFDEPATPQPPAQREPSAIPGEPTREPGELRGLPGSPGIAIGPLRRLPLPALPETLDRALDADAEWARLQAALAEAETELAELGAGLAARAGDQAAILAALRLVLRDPDLLGQVRARIQSGQGAVAAWRVTLEDLAAQYEALDDPTLRARAADLRDLGDQVRRHLSGGTDQPLALPGPGILVAADLGPARLAQLQGAELLGLCLAGGSATAHSAILARSLGIPAVVGLGPALLALPEGLTLALDGEAGRIWIAPPPEALAELERRRADWLAARAAAQAAARSPARTRDGRRVPVLANIAGPRDAAAALAQGAEGVGLLRTELLFADRRGLPTEQEQARAYGEIADLLGGRPLTIRTLDVGGDKPLPGADFVHGAEANPFLGQRGLRLTLARPELLKTQLRAILRASPGRALRILLPMVSTPAELDTARALLGDAQRALQAEGVAFDEAIPLGIMVEVPAAALLADHLALMADFFSLGTNDLSQYVMAADRTNPQVAHLADPLEPAVLRLMRRAVEAAHAAGITVSVCGELAGDPVAVALLLGLGVDELSANPAAIPGVKAALSQVALAEARQLAEACLALGSAQAVRRLLAVRPPARGPATA